MELQLQQQKTSHDQIAEEKEFRKGERVYVRNFGQGSRCLSAVIGEVTGPVSYVVRLEDNRVMRRHADHIRRQATASSPTIVDATEEVDDLEDFPNSAVLSPADHAGDVTTTCV